jgi:hypothetical protein
VVGTPQFRQNLAPGERDIEQLEQIEPSAREVVANGIKTASPEASHVTLEKDMKFARWEYRKLRIAFAPTLIACMTS